MRGGLAAIAELTSRRCDKQNERARWACDGWDSVAGEVACALGVSPKKASAQMTLSLTLRHRLPQVAALYAQGKVSYRVISTIAWRTHFVDDNAALLDAIDTALAQRAAAFGELSDYKLDHAIDYWVSRHDPDALRTTQTKERTRDLYVGKKHDDRDTTAVWGRLYASDAAVLDRRLMQLVAGICDDDPRSIAERRADALGALAAGAPRLACRCPRPDCPAAGNDGRAAGVVIHVGQAGRVLALPGSDVPLPRLRAARRILRHRPHNRPPGRTDASVQPQMPMQIASFAENVFDGHRRLGRPSAARRHRHLDGPHRQNLQDPARQPNLLP